jgi:hypothetical protein
MSATSYALDAAAILGIGTPSTEPLPAPIPGEIVLRIPDSLSLQGLRDSPIGKQLMHQQDWYDKYQWSKEALPAGTYRLRVPVPGSNRKTASEQAAMLPAGEELAPVVLVAAALLCIQRQGGPDPLNGDWTRCAEQTAGGCRVGLTWYVGGLYGTTAGTTFGAAACGRRPSGLPSEACPSSPRPFRGLEP